MRGGPLRSLFVPWKKIHILWAKKQPVISRSSPEAWPLLPLSFSGFNLSFKNWNQLLLPISSIVTTDNISTIALVHNSILHARTTKHMELDLFFVKEKVLNKLLRVLYILGHHHCLDIMTTALSTNKFEEFRTKLTVWDSSSSPSIKLAWEY